MKLDRRTLSLSLAALLPAGLGGFRPLSQEHSDRVTLTDVEGLIVGHRTRDERPTGCSVVLALEGATGGVAVRGAAPGTRELALLEPSNSVPHVHGIVLSGGSAFGLATADGVMRWLHERGHGFATSAGVVPIVPAAILYDLGIGDGSVTPNALDGYQACEAADDSPVVSGSLGAGTGATVGKIFGAGAMKGGLGSAGFRFDDGTVVAAMVAVNCRGDVRHPRTGSLIAGARTPDGQRLRDSEQSLLAGVEPAEAGAGENTTIGIVATNRTLDKSLCNRLAGVAHDGIARAVVPAHTRWDGDTLFCLGTNRMPPPSTTRDHDLLDVAAAAAVAAAIVDAAISAVGLPGLPAARDLGRG